MLSDKQIRVLNLLIYENKLKKEAAEDVGVHPGTVSDWFRIPEFAKTYEEMRYNLLQEASQRVLKEMIRLAVEAESESVRVAAGKDLLSRVGMDPVMKQEITQKTITVGVIEDEYTTKPEEEHIQLEVSTAPNGLPKKV